MTNVAKIDKILGLYIAQEGEHATVQIQMDMSDWLEQWPVSDGFGYYIMFRPPDESFTSPVVSTLEDSILTWTVTSGETAVVGIGHAEVRAVSNDGEIKKSRVIPVSIEESLDGTEGEIPPTFQNWATQVLTAANRVDQAAAIVETDTELIAAYKTAAETARDEAQEAQEAAAESATSAAGSEANALTYAARAETAAGEAIDTHGIFWFEIDDDEVLWLYASDNLTGLTFEMDEEGVLYAVFEHN